MSSWLISMALDKITGPVSIPFSITIIQEPVFLSPASIDLWIGAAPLHLGKRLAWPLIQPNGGILRYFSGNINPYATTTTKSGFNSLNFKKISSFFREDGVNVLIFKFLAAFSTGDSFIFIPLPLGRAG